MTEQERLPAAALPVTETQLQATLIGMARVHGWLVSHFRPAGTRSGRYRTPLEGHRGFPDLILARRGVVFAWELKGYRGVKRPQLGRPEPAQLLWLEHLAGGVTDARVVYPADVDDAIAALRTGRWPS